MKHRFKNPRFWLAILYVLALMPLVIPMMAISALRLALYFFANKVDRIERKLNSILHKVTRINSLNEWILKCGKSK